MLPIPKPFHYWLIATACALQLSGLHAQTSGPDTLWRTYMASGAYKVSDENWDQAEVFFKAATDESKECSSPVPLAMIAKYSFAVTQYELGKTDSARTILSALDKTLKPADVSPEYRGVVESLNTIGTALYDKADAIRKDAEDKKLKDDDLQKADNEADLADQFARRYFEWSLIIDHRFIAPNSPELRDLVAYHGLSAFKAKDYDTSIAAFTQLDQILQTEERRDKHLSSGSMKYSLSAHKVASPVLNTSDFIQTRNSAAPTAHLGFEPGAVAILLGRSYLEKARSEAADKKIDSAVRYYKTASATLEPAEEDKKYGKYSKMILIYVFDEEADLLRENGETADSKKLKLAASRLKLQTQ
jgi:hypothetical protein